MSNDVFSSQTTLEYNSGATAAALHIVGLACSAGDDTSKVALLKWLVDGNNLELLRDKIKASAADD